MDGIIAAKKQDFDEHQTQLKSLQNELKQITSELTNDELDLELERIENENKELTKTLEDLAGKQKVTISEEDMLKIETKAKEYELEWKKRRRGCMEMVDTI